MDVEPNEPRLYSMAAANAARTLPYLIRRRGEVIHTEERDRVPERCGREGETRRVLTHPL